MSKLDVEKTVKMLMKQQEEILERLCALENGDSGKKKRERKPMSAKEKAALMKSRARSLIGKKINGWTISSDKLDVIASKPGKKDIRVSGMKKREEFEAMLK